MGAAKYPGKPSPPLGSRLSRQFGPASRQRTHDLDPTPTEFSRTWRAHGARVDAVLANATQPWEPSLLCRREEGYAPRNTGNLGRASRQGWSTSTASSAER